MPSERLTPDPTPLIATLRKEAERAGIVYDWADPAFARKISRLMAMVPREYEITQAWSAFLHDGTRGCTPFYFPERFSKYQVKAKIPAAPAENGTLLVVCPTCHAEYQRLRASCPYCEDRHDVSGSGFVAWLAARKAGIPAAVKSEPDEKDAAPDPDAFEDDMPEVG